MGDSGVREQTETNGSDRARALVAGGKVAGIVPQNFDECWRIAKIIKAAGDKRSEEIITTCILHGLEVGFPPMQAAEVIAIINGRRCIYGDGIPALLWTHKFKILEYYEGEGANRVAVCQIMRPEGNTVERRFSVADAKTAKLWGKEGPWSTYPDRMLQMRARGFAARDGAPDVLRGLILAEEAADIPMRDITPAQPTIEHQPEEPAPMGANATGAEVYGPRKSSAEGKRDGTVKVFNAIHDDIAKCTDAQQCIGIWKMNQKALNTMHRMWFDTLAQHFMAKVEDFGMIIDIDDYGWPILPREAPDAPL